MTAGVGIVAIGEEQTALAAALAADSAPGL